MIRSRRPEWLQKKISPAAHGEMNQLLEDLHLHTVCREAHCPNISECYGNNQATFLILGTICTRLCSFCNVTKRLPVPVDQDEPGRVAEAVQRLRLRHVVITSPTRDDLPDGGAGLYAATVRAIRSASPDTAIELLIPDFRGNRESVATVVASRPDILGHNVETVPRLYQIREGAEYRRSLRVLQMIAEFDAALPSKSGIMLGMGETEEEVVQVFADLRGGRLPLPEHWPIPGAEQASLPGSGISVARPFRALSRKGSGQRVPACGERALCEEFLPGGTLRKM